MCLGGPIARLERQFRRGLNCTIPRVDDDNALTSELVWTVVTVGMENLPAECRMTWQLSRGGVEEAILWCADLQDAILTGRRLSSLPGACLGLDLIASYDVSSSRPCR